ncbi:hypothetical protein [Yoonia sp. R2-816]|uniref:hypothetical protein n=1 Tax=Yoonia sp. R2-816 TaxID=3342638 RepID=UPI00372678FC
MWFDDRLKFANDGLDQVIADAFWLNQMREANWGFGVDDWSRVAANYNGDPADDEYIYIKAFRD